MENPEEPIKIDFALYSGLSEKHRACLKEVEEFLTDFEYASDVKSQLKLYRFYLKRDGNSDKSERFRISLLNQLNDFYLLRYEILSALEGKEKLPLKPSLAFQYLSPSDPIEWRYKCAPSYLKPQFEEEYRAKSTDLIVKEFTVKIRNASNEDQELM